ncbi:MAG: hypothetical protein HY047_04775 [Acidobacteria bacterium]|nr:hypothetical protein [Acidobacteriota bacterium]
MPLRRTLGGWIGADIATVGVTQLLATQGAPSASARVEAGVMITALTLGIDLLTKSAFKLPSQVTVTLAPSADCR